MSSPRNGDPALAWLLGVYSRMVKPRDPAEYARAIRVLGSYRLLLNEPLRGHAPAIRRNSGSCGQ